MAIFPVSELVKLLSHVQLFETPWTVAYQAPPFMEFSRQKYGVGCHFLLLGIFPTQRSNPDLPHCRQILYQLIQQGRLMLKLKLHYLDHLIQKPHHGLLHSLGKTLMLGKTEDRRRMGETEDEMAGWHHQLNGHEF